MAHFWYMVDGYNKIVSEDHLFVSSHNGNAYNAFEWAYGLGDQRFKPELSARSRLCPVRVILKGFYLPEPKMASRRRRTRRIFTHFWYIFNGFHYFNGFRYRPLKGEILMNPEKIWQNYWISLFFSTPLTRRYRKW